MEIKLTKKSGIMHFSRQTLLALCLLPALAFAAPARFQQLGTVAFGDQASETQAEVRVSESQIGPGAPGCKARYIATAGEVRFSLPVDPARPTFVTLKMWGSDVVGTVVATGSGSITLGSPRVDLWVNGKVVDAQDFELLSGTAALPGRFFYRTIRLPQDATQGKSTLELTLKPAQQVGGGYAAVGGPAPRIAPKGAYSRGYYQAITHVGNFIPDDALPPDPALVPVTKMEPLDFALLRKRLIEGLDGAAEALMSRQLYGPQFDKAAITENIPPAVHGLFCKRGLATYLQIGGTANPDWLTPVTGSGSGRLHSASGFIFMRVYQQNGSRFYKDPEMIGRTIALLDGYRRYQGANGAWEIGGGSDGWIGGPHRKDEAGGLQGYFIEGLARSFLAVWPYVKDSPQVLDARIDDDGSGHPDVTRREAWTAIFREYLKNQVGQPGGVANQARANAIGAILAIRALNQLSPGDTTGATEVSNLIAQATGLAPHPKGVWMLTQAGVSLEAMGFCPAYGQHTNAQFPELIQASDDPRLRGQFAKAIDLFSFMVFPLNGAKGGPLFVSGPEGSRHHEFPGMDLDSLALVWAANHMQSPFAGWAVRNSLESSHNLEAPLLTNDLGVHLLDEAIRAVHCLDALPELEKTLDRPEVKNYVLPSTAPDSRTKNDPQVGLSMVHMPGRTLYTQITNGGRYQLLGRNTEAFGNLDFEEKNGVRVIRYGPWLIAQNITATARVGQERGHDTVLTALPAVSRARDLVSGKMINLDQPVTLPPLTTVIFDLSALGNPEVRDVAPATVSHS
jgi:hypothetical protein